jgi:hypothetical protein
MLHPMAAHRKSAAGLGQPAYTTAGLAAQIGFSDFETIADNSFFTWRDAKCL